MLEFREYSGFDTFKVIYTEEGHEIGILDLRKSGWVFVPDNTVSYYYGYYIEEISNKLKELNSQVDQKELS